MSGSRSSLRSQVEGYRESMRLAAVRSTSVDVQRGVRVLRMVGLRLAELGLPTDEFFDGVEELQRIIHPLRQPRVFRVAGGGFYGLLPSVLFRDFGEFEVDPRTGSDTFRSGFSSQSVHNYFDAHAEGFIVADVREPVEAWFFPASVPTHIVALILTRVSSFEERVRLLSNLVCLYSGEIRLGSEFVRSARFLHSLLGALVAEHTEYESGNADRERDSNAGPRSGVAHEDSSLVRASELPTPDASGRTLGEAGDGLASRGPSAAPSSEEEEEPGDTLAKRLAELDEAIASVEAVNARSHARLASLLLDSDQGLDLAALLGDQTEDVVQAVHRPIACAGHRSHGDHVADRGLSGANENPLTFAETVRYAAILRSLLASLDREVVFTALVGECESDLLDTERELVDSFREFLDGRVLVPLQFDGKRGRGLTLLDAFEDEVLAAEHGNSSRLVSSAAATAGESDASLREAAGGGFVKYLGADLRLVGARIRSAVEGALSRVAIWGRPLEPVEADDLEECSAQGCRPHRKFYVSDGKGGTRRLFGVCGPHCQASGVQLLGNDGLSIKDAIGNLTEVTD